MKQEKIQAEVLALFAASRESVRDAKEIWECLNPGPWGSYRKNVKVHMQDLLEVLDIMIEGGVITYTPEDRGMYPCYILPD